MRSDVLDWCRTYKWIRENEEEHQLAITVGRGVVSALSKGAAFIQVTGPSDTKAAREVLNRFAFDLLNRGDQEEFIEWAGATVDLPDGPGVFFDLEPWDKAQRRDLIRQLEHRLKRAGIESATIAVPKATKQWDGLDADRGAVVTGIAYLGAYGDPNEAEQLPDSWLAAGVHWLSDSERMSMDGLALPDIWVPPEDALALARIGYTSSPTVYLFGDGRKYPVMSVAFKDPAGPFLLVAANGVDSGEPLAAQAERVTKFLLDLRPRPVYACVAFYPWMCEDGDDWKGLNGTDEPTTRSGEIPYQIIGVVDKRVTDARWWQVLGPGHRRRLGGWPESAEVEPLDDGQAVVKFGTALEWASFGSDAEERQHEARTALGSLIVNDDDEAFFARMDDD